MGPPLRATPLVLRTLGWYAGFWVLGTLGWYAGFWVLGTLGWYAGFWVLGTLGWYAGDNLHRMRRLSWTDRLRYVLCRHTTFGDESSTRRR